MSCASSFQPSAIGYQPEEDCQTVGLSDGHTVGREAAPVLPFLRFAVSPFRAFWLLRSVFCVLAYDSLLLKSSYVKRRCRRQSPVLGS